MSALLEIKNVSKAFDSTQALTSVSLEVYENEFFAILGPSGCGKTTLLRALAGFESLDSGDILVSGHSVLGVPANRRPINLMFQSYALFPHLSVFENIAYGLRRGKLGRAEIDSRVGELLSVMGLTDLSQRRPHQLSGGQKQRVALARAIAKSPKLLLLDEPLSALDRKVRADMQLELKRLQHEVGITFVVVTHDQEEAMSMADRIAVMESGQVVQVATPVELYKRPANAFVADFIGTSNLFPGTLGSDGFHLENGPKVACALEAEGSVPLLLVLRPEEIVPDDGGFLEGSVRSTNFRGSTCLVAADCGMDVLVKYLVSNQSVPTVGERVRVSWAPDAGLLVADG